MRPQRKSLALLQRKEKEEAVLTPTLTPYCEIMVLQLWVYVCPTGTRKFIRVDGQMDEAEKKTVLRENLLEAAEDWRLQWRFKPPARQQPETHS